VQPPPPVQPEEQPEWPQIWKSLMASSVKPASVSFSRELMPEDPNFATSTQSVDVTFSE
jgi:hypothetical protein